MKAEEARLPGIYVIEPTVFEDSRGWFFESFQSENFAAAVGRRWDFVQDNQSRSVRGVIRGLHYQVRRPQGKLVRALRGEIFDVAVDLRVDSPTFGMWFGTVLSEENRKALWIPPGFAHGFQTLSALADVFYKATDYYAPEFDRTLRWDDPTLAIDWPLAGERIVSEKDSKGVRWEQAEKFGGAS
jgi:dTDP-4-dehydrorhamnose 3,5-epimerase